MTKAKRDAATAQRAISGPFAVRRSATGLGLFATRDIPAGRRLVEYTGPRITLAQALRRKGRYLFELEDGRYVDGSGRDNLARYINHACRPNCATSELRGRIWISSIRPITAGDELTYDYGPGYTDVFFGEDGCRCATCREGKSR